MCLDWYALCFLFIWLFGYAWFAVAVLLVCLVGWLDLFALLVHCGSLCGVLSGFGFTLFVVYVYLFVEWVGCLLIVVWRS